jgi:hypothetical protein
VAPDSGTLPNQNKGAPGPSLLGIGEGGRQVAAHHDERSLGSDGGRSRIGPWRVANPQNHEAVIGGAAQKLKCGSRDGVGKTPRQPSFPPSAETSQEWMGRIDLRIEEQPGYVLRKPVPLN